MVTVLWGGVHRTQLQMCQSISCCMLGAIQPFWAKIYANFSCLCTMGDHLWVHAGEQVLWGFVVQVAQGAERGYCSFLCKEECIGI